MKTDLRFAVRQLFKAPGFTAVAVLALALGIGSNTAIFSIVNSVFLRPLPYQNPDQILVLRSTDEKLGLTRAPFSYTRYLDVREDRESFSSVAIAAFNGFTLTGRGDAKFIQGMHASANYLPTLGVTPQIGRNFNDAEDQPGGPDVVMVSQHFWKRELNSDPNVLGQTLTISDKPHTIIGVLPEVMSDFPNADIDFWLPRPKEVSYLFPSQLENGAFTFQVIARLKPGVTLDQARSHLAVIAGAYRNSHPKNVDAPSTIVAEPMLDDLVGEQGRTYGMLFAAVACVLLIACANVANLLLARFTNRRKEIALRFALGASRTQVVRQLLIESMLVAISGAAIGVLLARWSIDGIIAIGADLIPRATDISIDPRALVFTLAAAIATGLAMGILPALQASGVDVNEALKDSSRGSSSAAQSRLRGGLLVGEISLSLILLIAAGLLLTSFGRLQHVSAGFNPDGVLVAGLDVPPSKYPGGPKRIAFYRQLHERLQHVPGATSAALSDRVPLTGNVSPAPIAIAGQPPLPMGERATANRHLITPGFFKTVGIPIKQGRDFSERDTPESQAVAIVNEAFARKHFPDENPIGRTVITGMLQAPAEVVGVVGDIRATNLHSPPAPDYYLPALQRPEEFTSIMVRTEGDPTAMTATLRAALAEVDPDVPLLDPQPLTALVERTMANRRLVMSLLGGFAALALVLASIGVYSVMACIVSQRTAEIGIRIALGATPTSVSGMVIAQGLKLAAIGIAIGTAAALAVTRLMQQALFEVQPNDPVIYVGLAALILAIAALACWIPARRATRIDPIVALRSE